MSDLQKRLQMARLPPMPQAGPRGRGAVIGGKKGMGIGKRDYTPVGWDKYFTTMKDVKIGNNTFRVYEKGEEGPVCLLLHGGGFSALSWALLAESLTSSVTCRCVALDLRGHGDTYTSDDYALSADNLAKDVFDVFTSLYGDDHPPVVLVGHSMGGAIAVEIAYRRMMSSIVGLTVIDVVEGTALEALTTMQSFLRSRPASFNSLQHAIEWCVRSGHVRNLESAKVSMVGQVKRIDNDKPATADVDTCSNQIETVGTDDIIEEEEDNTAEMKPPPQKQTQSEAAYTWRIDLSQTEPFWRGWFEGLSKKFLDCEANKLLLLAGVDRLDKDLTVGQMQGKFQMQVLPQAGHAVHEDAPDKVADVIATFCIRHKFATVKGDFQRTFPAC